MLVGAGFAVRASWQLFNDDFLWIASLFIGGFAILVALLFLALAASAVGFGLTIGAWLLIDRPGARWYAGFYAAGGATSGVFVLSMQTWVTRVVGWSTVGLAAALLVAVLVPQSEVAATLTEAPSPPPDPVPSLTQPLTEGGRFVL